MHLCEAQGRAAVKPTVPAAINTPGWFQSGTVVDFGILNSIVDEMKNFIEGQGLSLDRTDDSQMYQALVAGLISGSSVGAATTDHTAAVLVSTTSGAFGTDSLVAASRAATVDGDYSAAIACDLNGVSGADGVIGDGCFAAACDNLTDIISVAGLFCAAIATQDPVVSTLYGAILGGATNQVGSLSSVIIGSQNSKIRSNNGGVAPQNAVMLASSFCDFDLGTSGSAERTFAVAGGYDAASLIAPLWRIESRVGTMRAVSAFQTSGLDYAEMFLNGDGVEHPPGRILTRKGTRALLGQPGTRTLGTVSTSPTVVGGDDGIAWSKRYLRDEFGAPLWEDATHTDKVYDPKEMKAYRAERKRLRNTPMPKSALKAALRALPKPQATEVKTAVKQMVKNPAYNPTLPQVSRRSRPKEYTCVALLGQVLVAVDATVSPEDFIVSGVDGIGTKSTKESNLECMEIREPYDAAKGYAVAFCYKS